ncbi:MAG: hypothetical protein QXW01_03540 [Candidatus Aenigmatarchaeota archaeon]
MILTATGSITDDNDAQVDIVARDLTLTAETGIDLDTEITGILTATNNTSGSIDINNTGNLRIESITNEGRAVILTATGLIRDDNDAEVDIEAGDLTLTAGTGIDLDTEITGILNATNNTSGSIDINNTGDLQIGLIINTGRPVILTATGSITDDNDAQVDIVARDLTLTAETGINLDTEITGILTATNNTSGSIDINNTRDLLIGLITNTGRAVILTATGLITDNDAQVDIVAGDLTLTAWTGIDLDTQVNRLAARNITQGGIDIINIGDLTLDDLANWGYAIDNAGSGNISIVVNSNLTINASVISNGGDITLRANSGAIIQNANGDITTNGGDYTGYAQGAYYMEDGAVIDTRNLGIIDIDAGGDITIGQLITNSEVYLNSGGAIIDGGDTGGNDIIGAAVELVAQNGIGTATNAIDTQVNTLAARTTNGQIYINQTGILIIGPVGITNGVSVTNGGPIWINTNGGLLILDSNQDIISNGGPITINSVALTQNNDADIISSGGDITLTITTSLTQNSDSKIDAGTGNVEINAFGNIALDEIRGNNVTLTSNSGYIEENVADAGIDITATNALVMNAANGIGNLDQLEISTNYLTASNTNSGAINLANTGNLIVNSITNVNRPVILIATGSITDNDAQVDIVAGDLTLTAGTGIDLDTQITGILNATNNTSGSIDINNTGNLLIGLITNTGRPVILTATGSITDDDVRVIDIIGSDLIIWAVNNIDLDTQVSRLAARNSSSGVIDIINTGDLVLDDLAGWNYSLYNAGSGTISIIVNSNLTIDDPVISNTGSITLRAYSGAIIQNANGDITTNGGIYTGYAQGPYYMADGAVVNVGSSGVINIDAGGDVTIGQLMGEIVLLNSGGAIIDGGDTGGNDVIGNRVELVAQNGIGTAADAIDTQVNTLAAKTTNGQIYINQQGNLLIDNVGATDGVSVTNGGPIWINTNGGSLTLANANQDIVSNGGPITINSGALTQNNGADIISSGGNITLTITSLTQNSDSKIDAGNGNVNINASGNIALDEIRGNVVDIRTTTGNIEEQTPDTDRDIVANDLILVARNGIGSNNILETVGSRLNAYNTTSGNIQIDNTGDLTIDNFASLSDYGVRNNGGSVYIDVDGSIDIPGTSGYGIYASSNVELIASGNITAGSDAAITAINSLNGYISLTASNIIYLGQNYYADIYANNGNITLNAKDITIDNYTYVETSGVVTFNADNNIFIITRQTGQETRVYGGNGVDLNAGNNINIIGGSIIESDKNIYINAGNDILIRNSEVLADDSVYFDAGGNIEIGYVEAGNYVEMVADGAILDNNGSAMNIVTTDLVMLAGEGIGTENDPIETTVSNLQAGSEDGGIYIANTGDLNLVDILGDPDLPFALGAADGNINVSTTENLTISGLVSATGSVYLYAETGDITDNNNGVDIIAGKTSGLYAGGLIGIESGATKWFDPIEVQINGDLYVYAGQMYNFVSVAIDGIVDPRDMIIVNPNWGIPPGLIIFNGRVNGGEEIERWYRGVGNAIHYIGIEPYIYQTLILYIIDPSFFEPAPTYWDLQQYKKAIEQGLVLK